MPPIGTTNSHFVPLSAAQSGPRIGGSRTFQEAWPTMLTTVEIRALKPAERPFKVADADGLFPIVVIKEWRRPRSMFTTSLTHSAIDV